MSSILAFSALLLKGACFYFSHFEKHAHDTVIFVMVCPKPWIFLFSKLQAKAMRKSQGKAGFHFQNTR